MLSVRPVLKRRRPVQDFFATQVQRRGTACGQTLVRCTAAQGQGEHSAPARKFGASAAGNAGCGHRRTYAPRAYRYACIPALNGAAGGAGGPQQCGAAASSASFLCTGVSRCDGSGAGAAWDACGTGARRGEWCLDGGRRRGRRGTAVCVHGVGIVAGCRLKICGGRRCTVGTTPVAWVGLECVCTTRSSNTSHTCEY